LRIGRLHDVVKNRSLVHLNFLPYVITKGLFTFVPLFIDSFEAEIYCFHLLFIVAEVAKLYPVNTKFGRNLKVWLHYIPE